MKSPSSTSMTLTLFLILLPVPGSFTNGVLGLFTK
jgi:hypothetical protein